MKIETQTKQNVENQDNSVQMQPEDAQILSSANLPFSELMAQHQENSSFININSNIPVDYNYDSINMSLEDSLFFIKLANEGRFSVETEQNGDFKSMVQLEVSQNIVTQKTIDVTSHITSLIEKAQNTQKPVRITFDNDVSVVLKIDKQGKVTAEFIPGSIEVENYLKAHIPELKQRFDEQNLPYNDLLYRNNNRQNKRNKEKGEQ